MAGTAVGSTPILDRSVLTAYYQSHEEGASDVGARQALPDHYPLVTREGTVPVAALSERGLFSQARYRAFYAIEDYEPPAFDSGEHEAERAEASLAVGVPPAEQTSAAAPAETQDVPAPLALAEGPARLGGEGQAKMIDVRAALALR